MDKKGSKTNHYVSLDRDVYAKLKECADTNMRSIKGQMHYILRDFFERRKNAI
jgi:hypothetical protein